MVSTIPNTDLKQVKGTWSSSVVLSRRRVKVYTYLHCVLFNFPTVYNNLEYFKLYLVCPNSGFPNMLRFITLGF